MLKESPGCLREHHQSPWGIGAGGEGSRAAQPDDKSIGVSGLSPQSHQGKVEVGSLENGGVASIGERDSEWRLALGFDLRDRAAEVLAFGTTMLLIGHGIGRKMEFRKFLRGFEAAWGAITNSDAFI